jgi:hypothetical protein
VGWEERLVGETLKKASVTVWAPNAVYAGQSQDAVKISAAIPALYAMITLAEGTPKRSLSEFGGIGFSRGDLRLVVATIQ